MWELLFHEVYKEIGSPPKKKNVYREIIMYFHSVINAY